MSEIETKKAEVYDLMIQQTTLNNQLQALNQVINQKVQEIQKMSDSETRKEDK